MKHINDAQNIKHALAHIQRAEELASAHAFGVPIFNKRRTTQKTVKEVKEGLRHPYKRIKLIDTKQPHRMLNGGNLESAHHYLPQQFPNNHYKIMSGKNDSGFRIVFQVGFIFYLYHYSAPEKKQTFDGPNAPNEIADMIHRHIPNAWMPHLDWVSKWQSDLNLA